LLPYRVPGYETVLNAERTRLADFFL